MTLPPRYALSAPREVFATLVRSAAESLALRTAGPEWAGEWTASYQRTAPHNAALRSILSPDDPLIRADLELCACAAAGAHLAAITPGTDPIVVPAPGQREIAVTRAQGRPKQLSAEQQWREGVLAAVITRNAAALAILTRMPLDAVRRFANEAAAPWFAREFLALAALFGHGRGARDLLLDAARSADSEHVDSSAKNLVRDLIVPELELGLHVLQTSGAELDTDLESALIHHHHFYVEDGADDYRGQLALAPLALAAFAHDRGVTTHLDSDYAPRWLIEGRSP
jgi:hypothetical protein